MELSDLPFHLSPRQTEVLGLLVEGKSNATIAEILEIKEGSVKVHVHAILGTMRVSSRAQAIATVEQFKSEALKLESRRRISEKEQFLDGILANIADAVVTIDHLGTIETFNPSAEKMFDYLAADAIGQNVKLLMPEPYRGEHDGNLRSYNQTGISKILNVGPREVSARKSDGSLFPMELSIGEMTVGERTVFIGSMRDITLRKQSEDALAEIEARYALAIIDGDDGIWELNCVTGERFLSPRWKEILGYQNDDVLDDGDIFAGLLHPDDAKSARHAIVRHHETAKPYEIEIRLRHKEGHYVWLRMSGRSSWDENGVPTRMAGSIRDISHEKHA
jgi:PAS domain S-box-containing protein